MLAPLAAGLFSLAVLIALSGRLSPERGKLEGVAPAGPVSGPDNRVYFLAIGLLGIAVGVPAALGLVPGNVLVVLGGMVATMTARRLLLPAVRERPPPPQDVSGEVTKIPKAPPSSWLWFVPLAWSVLAASSSAGMFELRGAMAAQAVLGPAVLAFGPGLSVLLILAFGAGLASAVFWVRENPSIAEVSGSAAEAALRWGEAALAGTAVSAAYFGPSVGALVFGPAAGGLPSGVAGSFLLTCMVVGLISWTRRRPPLPRPRLIQGVCAGVALVALGGAVFGR